MSRLRQSKQHAATAIGLADIAGAWTLEQVTRADADRGGDIAAGLRHLLATRFEGSRRRRRSRHLGMASSAPAN